MHETDAGSIPDSGTELTPESRGASSGMEKRDSSVGCPRDQFVFSEPGYRTALSSPTTTVRARKREKMPAGTSIDTDLTSFNVRAS